MAETAAVSMGVSAGPSVGHFSGGGQRLLLFNLEQRTATLVRWWIFGFAAALFTDVGAVWDEGDSIREQRFHWTAGPGSASEA